MAVLEAERAPAPMQGRGGVEEPNPYSAAEFMQIARAYPDLHMELTREGELIIMPPTLRRTGRKNAKLSARLENWSAAAGLGETFDSSTLFLLPDGSVLSPDACWVAKSQWDALSEEDQDEMTVLCPDFVAELRSKSDRLSAAQRKMREWINNGVRLGWLIDPQSNRVEIYRPGQDVEVLDSPQTLSGEDVLPGFVLDLKDILE